MRNWFKTIWAWGEFVATGNTDKIFNDEGYQEMARIRALNGKYALIDRDGDTIQTYSRERDARRGASRRGLSLT